MRLLEYWRFLSDSDPYLACNGEECGRVEQAQADLTFHQPPPSFHLATRALSCDARVRRPFPSHYHSRTLVVTQRNAWNSTDCSFPYQHAELCMLTASFSHPRPQQMWMLILTLTELKPTFRFKKRLSGLLSCVHGVNNTNNCCCSSITLLCVHCSGRLLQAQDNRLEEIQCDTRWPPNDLHGEWLMSQLSPVNGRVT